MPNCQAVNQLFRREIVARLGRRMLKMLLLLMLLLLCRPAMPRLQHYTAHVCSKTD
jgi:hypothetical protein